MKRRYNFALALAMLAVAQSAPARDRERPTWQALRHMDPITGDGSCVVAATDYVGKTHYSRSGSLYPIVEKNSKQGLLVGVSSGGQIRLPTGDIVWRVDDKPFRELKAADNPVNLNSAMPGSVPADSAAAKAMADTMALTMRLAQSAGATSTVASGTRAREMLAELRAGHSLLFRAAGASAAYGLPDNNAYRVGQRTEKGVRPIPIDASFGAALAACAINE
jgi:hypothetical protein